MSDDELCVTCGTRLVGVYCHVCGEKVLAPEDLRVAPFVRRALAGAFDADSRLWRSARLLLTRPGELTTEFVRGRREPYVHPLQLFLLANLVLFLSMRWLGGFDTFTTRLEWHVQEPLYGGIASELVAARATAGSPEAAAYRARFDEATPNYANSMVILMVPLIALGVALLQLRRRQPMVKHLVFALHFMAFLMLLSAVLSKLLWLLVVLAPAASSFVNSDMPVSLTLSTLLSIYMGVGFWRAYGDRIPVAVAKGIVGVLLTVPALLIYRAILFFTVYLTLD